MPSSIDTDALTALRDATLSDFCHNSPLLNDDCSRQEDAAMRERRVRAAGGRVAALLAGSPEKHVTHDVLSAQERAELFELLQDDPVLGPVLLRSEQIVCGKAAGQEQRSEFRDAAEFCVRT